MADVRIGAAEPGQPLDFVARLHDSRTTGPYSRHVVSGALAGSILEIDHRTLNLNEIRLAGASTFSTDIMDRVIALIESGRVTPQSRFEEAQTDFLSKERFGRIVVAPGAQLKEAGSAGAAA